MSLAQITEALSRIAAGNVPGASALYLNGRNGAPTTTFETVWPVSNAYTFLSANMSSPTIVSSDANDAAAGTGARTVTIVGVDSTFTAQTETATLNGATPVALTKNYMTINSMVVATVGSGGVPAGNLTLAAGGVTHGYIVAGEGEARSFVYCVPANYGLLMYDFFVSEEAASTGGNRAQLLYKVNLAPARPTAIMGTPINWALQTNFNVPLYFPEKTQLQAQFLSAAATSTVTAFSTCVLLNRNSADLYAKWI